MARRSIRRRRTVIGLAALVFGASGFVASGAIRVGSEGSLGDNWIQVSGASQAVSFDSLQPVNVGDSAGSARTEGSEGIGGGVGGGGNGEAGGDNNEASGSDGAGADDSIASQLQVIVDPTGDNIVDPSGTPLIDGALLPWTGSIHKTSLIRGSNNGLLLGIASDKVNKRAVTRYGTFNSTTPGDNVVFIIANGGSADSDTSLPPADITMRLYAGDNNRRIESDQIRFPYRVLDSDRDVVATGNDLTDPSEGSIELATGEIIEVIIEFDTTDGSADLKILSEVRFFANGGNN